MCEKGLTHWADLPQTVKILTLLLVYRNMNAAFVQHENNKKELSK